MKLYEIPQKYHEFYRQLEEQDGVLTEKLQDEFTALQTEALDKIENTLLYIRNQESLADSIDAEITRLRSRKSSLGKRVDSLKTLLLRVTGPEYKADFPVGRMSWRKTESVRDIDIEQVPPEYVREKIVRAIDKVELKKACERGELNADKYLQVNFNLQVR